MKILILAEVGPTGEWIATERLLSAVKRITSRVQFFLMGFAASNRYPREIFTKTVLLPLSSPQPPLRFLKQIVGDLARSRRAVKQLSTQAGSADYVIVTHYLLALAVWGLRQLRGKPIIYYFHGLRSLDAIKLAYPTLKQRALYYLERLALRQSAAIMVPSGAGASLVRRLLGTPAATPKIYIVHHVLPLVFFSPVSPPKLGVLRGKLRLKEGEKIILYCGRIAPRKGLENLMIGFARLARRHPEVKLVMAVPAENMEQSLYNLLRQLIKHLGITRRVEWIWDLTLSERVALYQLSLLAVLPSEFEISSLFFIEALASGTPVVATRTGGMGKILAKIDPGLILADNKPPTITTTLERILALPYHRREKLRDLCQAQTRKQAGFASGRRFLQVLAKVSGRS